MNKAIIQLEKVLKTYRKRKSKNRITAVDEVTFSVNKGEILGLLGPNGAGKTSIIKMMCGLLKADSGNIFINNIDVQKDRKKALNHISAVLEGNRNLYWRLTVRENLEYFMGNRGIARKTISQEIENTLKIFNLKEKENELVNRLSRGMQQKLAIAVTVLASTDVILLDEPTLGLDVETSYEVRQLLKDISLNYHRTVIISSHDMQVIQELCDRVVIIDKGKLVTDDYIENLMELLDAKSYKIHLRNELNEEQLELLSNQFPKYTYTPGVDYGILEIALYEGEDIYELFEILKINRTILESIDREALNFEQVFLDVIRRGRLHETI